MALFVECQVSTLEITRNNHLVWCQVICPMFHTYHGEGRDVSVAPIIVRKRADVPNLKQLKKLENVENLYVVVVYADPNVLSQPLKRRLEKCPSPSTPY